MMKTADASLLLVVSDGVTGVHEWHQSFTGLPVLYNRLSTVKPLSKMAGKRCLHCCWDVVLNYSYSRHTHHTYMLLSLHFQKTNSRVCGSTCSGDAIAISLWKECTNIPSKFDRVSLENAPAPAVVAISSVKISNYPGSLRLGTSSASHLYINPPIPETTILIDSYGTFQQSPVNFDSPTLLSYILQKTYSDLSRTKYSLQRRRIRTQQQTRLGF